MTQRYVLSLPDATERRIKICERFDFFDLNFKIIDAKRFTKEEMFQLISERGGDFFDIGVGSVGCYWSHVEAWRRIAESSDRGAFVFEDDAIFSINARKFIVDDSWIPKEIEVCQLSYCPPNKYPKGRFFRVLKEIRLNDLDCRLLRIYSPFPQGTQGYWMSREAAEKALNDSSYHFKRPVDWFLFKNDSVFWKKSGVYSLSPAVVSESFDEKSLRKAVDLAESRSAEAFWENGERWMERKTKWLSDRVIHLFCKKIYHGFD